MGSRTWHLIFFTLLIASPAFGATKYVSPTGSATWVNCNSTSSPCAVSTALSNAVAGDIVLFMDGTYNAPTSPTYRDLVWNPSNSGTSGNPITFKALNRHQAIIKGTGSTSDSGVYAQPVIGAIGRNYITWDGFYLYARNSSDTADIFVTARIDGSTGCSVINNTFRAGSHNYGGATNNAGVFFQGADYLTIENNTFFGFIETSNNLNNAAVLGFPTNYVTIKNNTIYNCTQGIFLKDRVSYVMIENNFIRDCYYGVAAYNSNGGSSTDVTIHNNVFVQVDGRAAISTSNSAPVNNQVISNNTIYKSSSLSYDYGDIELKNTGISSSAYPKVYNNIIDRGWASLVTDGSANMLAECDHNQYSGSLRIITHKYQTFTTYTALAAWQSSGELYGGGNPGVGSLNSNPLFVNSSGTMTELADFALQAGSPSKGAGRNGVDMGADITLVGVDASGEPPLSPVLNFNILGAGATSIGGGTGSMTIQ